MSQEIDNEQIIEPGFNTEEYVNQKVLETRQLFQGFSGQYNSEIVDNSDDSSLSQSSKLLKHYLKQEGFAKHHIDVFDNWLTNIAGNNVYDRRLTFQDGRSICFENLRILPPRYLRDGQVYPLTPKHAREQGVTYGSDWHIDVVLRDGTCRDGRELDRRVGVCIGTIPTMLKSANCVLHGKTPLELSKLDEDPKDPGGYFIVSGTEKVILLQEQLALNKIFLMNMSNKGSVVARMTASTNKGTSLIELILDKKTGTVIKMKLPSMRVERIQGVKQEEDEGPKSLNVLRIFRIFGITEYNSMIEYIKLFIKPEHIKKSLLKLPRNIIDASISTNDIDVMMKKMRKTNLTEQEKRADVDRIFETDLFPHLNNLPGPDGETPNQRIVRIRTHKLYMLAIMIARLLEYLAGFRPVDNRDSWSNKRVEGAGRMMEQLFRNAWRKTLGIVQGTIESGSIKDLTGVVEKIKYSIITDTFHDSFISNNWGVKGGQMKNNITQTLERASVVASFAHINTIDVNISRTDKQTSLRMVQNDQWGLVDPSAVSEGGNCGIVKNLSLTAKVTVSRTDTDIIRFLLGDPSRGIPVRVSADPRVINQWREKIIVNGKFLGWCDGNETENYLRTERRNGMFPFDMSIIREEDWLYIDISPSRLVRPVLIVDENQNLVIDTLNLREAPINELLTSGAMEFISSWEQEYIKIAPTVEMIRKRSEIIKDANETYRIAVMQLEAVNSGQIIETEIEGIKTNLTVEEAQKRLETANELIEKVAKNKPYTHCEIDPIVILSVAGALTPWADHNQGPRNAYQIGMFKQALGDYIGNHLNRFDGKIKTLSFPNRAVVATDLYSIIDVDNRGIGQTISVAFMNFPYNEEDSFVFKKEFIDNGGFRMFKYFTYKTVVKHSGDVIETLTKPEIRVGEPEDRYKYIQMYESGNPNNGLPKIGSYLRQGDCVIGKMQYVPVNKRTENVSVILRVGDEGIVEKILVTSDNKTTTVIVKLRTMRIPRLGDKFTARCSQKGTAGLIIPEINLPFNDKGISPDVIINTSVIPSRVTLSYILELIAGKHGAMRGTSVNATTFKPFNFNEYRQTLKEYKLKEIQENFNVNLEQANIIYNKDYNKIEFGYEKMNSGLSGKPIDSWIYNGPIYFQALKHHVKDKIQARKSGQIKPISRQPPKGRSVKGGLRFGEMERDAGISHGASAFLRERLMFASDAYQAVFCKICGIFAVNDPNNNSYKKCRKCENSTEFGKYTFPYAYKLLIHLLAAVGINLVPEFVTSDEYINKLITTRNQLTLDVEGIQTELENVDQGMIEEMREIEEEDIETSYDEIYGE